MKNDQAAEPRPIFFGKPAEFRAWLARHHESDAVLWVGFYRKATGRPNFTWPESVDEALCYGWIDGLRKSIDSDSYMIRFTTRKPTSIWSDVNIGRVAALTKEGRMQPSGLAAFQRRSADKSGIYSYEQQKNAELDADAERRMREHPKAWQFYHSTTPYYRRVTAWWILRAKRPETREKRLAKLIAESEAGRRV